MTRNSRDRAAKRAGDWCKPVPVGNRNSPPRTAGEPLDSWRKAASRNEGCEAAGSEATEAYWWYAEEPRRLMDAFDRMSRRREAQEGRER